MTTSPVSILFSTGGQPINVTNNHLHVTGTMAIDSLPNITGSVNVTNSIFNITGTTSVNGVFAESASNATYPVYVGSKNTSGNLTSFKLFVDGTLQTKEREEATFTASALEIATGNGKHMLTLFNNSTSVIRVHSVFVTNIQSGTVTGVITSLLLRRVSSEPTSFTSGNIISFDSNDTIPDGVVPSTNGTIASVSTVAFYGARWSNDDWAAGTADLESADHALQTLIPLYDKRHPNLKPIVVRNGEGLTVQCVTNTTAGLFDLHMIASIEPTGG